MDFGLLPPETNSARIYAGPGAGPLLAAATAWDGLAADLHATAAAHHAVIVELTTGPWLGHAVSRCGNSATVAPFDTGAPGTRNSAAASTISSDVCDISQGLISAITSASSS